MSKSYSSQLGTVQPHQTWPGPKVDFSLLNTFQDQPTCFSESGISSLNSTSTRSSATPTEKMADTHQVQCQLYGLASAKTSTRTFVDVVGAMQIMTCSVIKFLDIQAKNYDENVQRFRKVKARSTHGMVNAPSPLHVMARLMMMRTTGGC
jgi:hypothetical protein